MCLKYLILTRSRISPAVFVRTEKIRIASPWQRRVPHDLRTATCFWKCSEPPGPCKPKRHRFMHRRGAPNKKSTQLYAECFICLCTAYLIQCDHLSENVTIWQTNYLSSYIWLFFNECYTLFADEILSNFIFFISKCRILRE